MPTLIIVAVLLLGLSCNVEPTNAAEGHSHRFDEREISEFYRGRVLRIVVGFPPGGGADVYTRLIARHLGRFIPGNPAIAVSNMAGAGSIIAGNQVFNNGARDGTEIGMLNGAVILEQLFGNPALHFDMAKFRYLAVPVTETYVMVVTRKSGIAKFSELVGVNAKQIVLGAIPNSTLEHAPILLRETLGANLKVVSGYKGSAAIRLAVDSGEIGGFFNPWSSVQASSPGKFKSGEWSVVAQLTDQPLGDLPANEIPAIADLVKDEDHRLLLRYGTSTPNQFGKVYMLPSGVPAERSAALEAAFAKTFADQSFLADAQKAKLPITPIIGNPIQRLVDDFLGMAPAIKERLQKALKR